MKTVINLTGQKYGRLTVIERVGKDNLWRCRCDCGNEKIANGSKLQSGNIKSCGCLNAENRERMRQWRIRNGS